MISFIYIHCSKVFFFVWDLRHTQTAKVIWRLFNFTGGGRSRGIRTHSGVGDGKVILSERL